MRRRTMLTLAPALACTGLRAQPWLVTPEEVQRWRADTARPLLVPRTAGAPVIEVLRPLIEGDAPLASPLPIALRFRAAADSTIAPQSFRVFYGAFGLDITSRLLAAVAVSAEGLQVERAAIPPGSHRLVLQVADTQGRTGTRELRFRVG
jgi:hypothetical protein